MSDGAEGAGNGGGAGAGDAGAAAAALAAAGDAGAGGDGGAAAAAAGAGDGAGAGAEPSWQSKFLSPELAADPTLARYKSLDDLAKGHKETMDWARGRVAIPKADDAAGFAEFVGKVRPEKAEAYEIAVPDGEDPTTANFFRGKFFERGLHPMQAKGLAEDWNQHVKDTQSALRAKSQEGLTAFEVEVGPAAYHQRLVAVDNMLKANGFDNVEVATSLEQMLGGAGPAMRFLAAMAEKTGELAKVDSTDTSLSMGTMSAESAQQQLDAMSFNKDPEFQKRLGDKTSSEYKLRQALLARVAKK